MRLHTASFSTLCLQWEAKTPSNSFTSSSKDIESRMKPKFISFIHPALRPIVLGIGLFLLFNCVLTLGITFSPINSRFNFSYGNYLPKKLSLMAQ